MNTAALHLGARWPGAVTRFQIWMLTRATARGFGVGAPRLRGLSPEAALLEYARFTRDEAERALREGRSLRALQQNLYREARALGERLRLLLRPKTDEEAMRLLALLYRNIGITLEGELSGELRVTACYFSGFYSGPVCRLISALDQGIFAGLCGGGSLRFSRRMTEGSAICRARLERERRRKVL